MKTITLILFAIIIIVGAIAIIITKLYYRNKEKKEKQNIEAELGINRNYAPRNRENIERRFRRRNNQQNQEIQRQSREIVAFSQTIPSQGNSEEIFDDYYGEPINSKFVNTRNRHNAPNANMSNPNVNRPINHKTPKAEEMERIINSPKDETIGNINDIKDMTNKDAQVASKISQAPMTDAHKEFIEDHKKGKIIIDNDEGSGIKIIKPSVEEVEITAEDTINDISEVTELPKNTDEEIENELNKIIEESKVETSPLLDEILKEINDSDVKDIGNIEDIDKEHSNIENTTEESIIQVVEEETVPEIIETETTEEELEKPRVRKLPEFNKDELETGETTLFDHQEKSEDEDIIEEDPEDVITPIFNVGKKAFKSIKSNLLNEEEEEVEAYDEGTYIDDDYEEEFYAITPLSEEEIKKELQEETATITPLNEDNMNEVEIEKAEDEEKIKAKEELDRLRKENTQKLANVARENEQSLASISKKPESKTSQKPTYQGPTEKIVIDGDSYELHKGLNIIFIYNNETYSSTILAMKPGFVGVKYRNKNVWVKNSRIKKVFKY